MTENSPQTDITASDSSAGTWAEYSYTTEPAH